MTNYIQFVKTSPVKLLHFMVHVYNDLSDGSTVLRNIIVIFLSAHTYITI